MVHRLQKLHNSYSFFLFGARGTGKFTLLKQKFESSKTETLWIDLLSDEDEDRFHRHPKELSYILAHKSYQRVVIDEIQKVPKLLDIVQQEMSKSQHPQFIMAGSSARKLKKGLGNLLAGRAFTYHLYPLTVFELKNDFHLIDTLCFGTLPGLLKLTSKEDKKEFLRSYVQTYLKEEIRMEQFLRKLDPFKDFLEIVAQQNGKIINYSKIANDVGVDYKTIINYFTLLEDTLLGFFLPPFHRSIRKQQRQSPKFYLFDLGVKKALERTLNLDIVQHTYTFGETFEHEVIRECICLNAYLKKEYKFSYLRTKDGAELDLIVQRPGQKDLLVEIKSTSLIKENHLKHIKHLQKDWDRPCEAQVWSLDQHTKKIHHIECVFWKDALKQLFPHLN